MEAYVSAPSPDHVRQMNMHYQRDLSCFFSFSFLMFAALLSLFWAKRAFKCRAASLNDGTTKNKKGQFIVTPKCRFLCRRGTG